MMYVNGKIEKIEVHKYEYFSYDLWVVWKSINSF